MDAEKADKPSETPEWHQSIDWLEIEQWIEDGLDPNAATAPDALLRLGRFVDAAALVGGLEKSDALLIEALHLAKTLTGSLEGADQATAYYFEANAYSGLWHIELTSAPPSFHAYGDPAKGVHAENAVLSLRRAAAHPSFGDLPPQRRCQIYTNLGNSLSGFGRSIEAIRAYDSALSILPSFSMARGNRAMATMRYGFALYEPSDQWIMLRHALADAATAAEPVGDQVHVEPDALAGFSKIRDDLRRLVAPNGDWNGTWLPFQPSLGESSEEQAYRKWCLRHRLFLNPINELWPYPAAAFDTVVPPGIVTSLDSGPPPILGAFSQLKQGFVSARYLLYEGLHSDEMHFSDRDTSLVDTLDYPIYGLGMEKVKLAFRSLYSLFDQIAFVLSDYLELSILPHRIAFRTLWYNKQNPERGLRSDITSRRNMSLLALFWLSKDLYEKRDGFVDAMQPEAQRLSEIRNHLEHRYLRVQAFSIPPYSLVGGDALAYLVEQCDLEAKALHLASLARSALIYLGLTVHTEERMRHSDKAAATVPMFTSTVDNEFKRRW